MTKKLTVNWGTGRLGNGFTCKADQTRSSRKRRKKNAKNEDKGPQYTALEPTDPP
jgi:hypothetical protein